MPAGASFRLPKKHGSLTVDRMYRDSVCSVLSFLFSFSFFRKDERRGGEIVGVREDKLGEGWMDENLEGATWAVDCGLGSLRGAWTGANSPWIFEAVLRHWRHIMNTCV